MAPEGSTGCISCSKKPVLLLCDMEPAIFTVLLFDPKRHPPELILARQPTHSRSRRYRGLSDDRILARRASQELHLPPVLRRNCDNKRFHCVALAASVLAHC